MPDSVRFHHNVLISCNIRYYHTVKYGVPKEKHPRRVLLSFYIVIKPDGSY